MELSSDLASTVNIATRKFARAETTQDDLTEFLLMALHGDADRIAGLTRTLREDPPPSAHLSAKRRAAALALLEAAATRLSAPRVPCGPSDVEIGMSRPWAWPGAGGVFKHEVTLSRGRSILGSAEVTSCEPCRLARVDQIGVMPWWRGRGIGRQVIERLRCEVPGTHWCTSTQRDQAAGFWERMRQQHPGEYFDDRDQRGRSCTHIEAQSVSTGDSPRSADRKSPSDLRT
jgi:GNAT superfamily N-acetyltransferase